LEAGRAAGDPDRGVELAHAVCRPPLLPARYIDVEGPERTRRFVRRSSCCLIYLATDGSTCASCPRRARRTAESSSSVGRSPAPVLAVKKTSAELLRCPPSAPVASRVTSPRRSSMTLSTSHSVLRSVIALGTAMSLVFA